MGRLADLIKSLLDDSDGHAHERRLEFYRTPVAYCGRFQLAPEAIAALYTMDPKHIHHYLLPNEGVDLYALMKEYEGTMDAEQWPNPGSYQHDPWSTDPASCHGAGAPIDPRGDVGIRWSGPHPGIEHVFTETVKLGQPLDLKIAGEGLLPRATIELVHGSVVYRTFATQYHECGFRRSYLRAKIAEFPGFFPEGSYQLRVRNPGSSTTFEHRPPIRVER
jgi:hypothetical protein